MLLKNAVQVDRVKAFTWDIFPGAEFELCYQGRKAQSKNLREGYVTKITEEGKTYQEFDGERFSKHFVQSAIKGWKGLKLHHLKDWMLVDETQDLNADVEFCEENALFLYENFKPFEDWVSTVVHSLTQFRNEPVGEVERESKEVSNLEG